MTLYLTLREMFSFTFVQKALAGGICVALSCAVLGSFLVLRRLCLIGDGLAHVGFAGAALALFLGASPLWIIIPLVMLLSLWIFRLENKAALYGDTAIGIVSSLAMAAGVILTGIGSGFNVDIYSYLFGNILAIDTAELALSAFLCALVIAFVKIFYHELFALTYDKDFAQAAGLKTSLAGTLLVLLTALTVALGIRVAGALLVSSLIIFPVVTALQFSQGFRATILTAAFVGAASVSSGLLLSFILDLPTGAVIVIVNFFLLCAGFAYGKLRR
jgi:zinc transport system permease protein